LILGFIQGLPLTLNDKLKISILIISQAIEKAPHIVLVAKLPNNALLAVLNVKVKTFRSDVRWGDSTADNVGFTHD
jgi:hypothetical protein